MAKVSALLTILDNRTRGSVGEFLSMNIESGSKLSFVSAYFTIYAYEKLKNQLNSVEDLKFLFVEPTFIKAMDPNKVNKRDFKINEVYWSVGELVKQRIDKAASR